MFRTALITALLFAVNIAGAFAQEKDFDRARKAMIREIEADARMMSQYVGKADFNDAVVAAMGRVARHRFVPERVRHLAYANRPLPIGHGQTISQPYIVALMTDLLELRTGDRVLEVGTGSGYQAAVLAELVAHVATVEIIAPLGLAARTRLAELGYDNVAVHVADGYYGLPEQAPFDAIIVTAAATHIPPPLIRQLRPGRRMVIPVGGVFMVQQLMVVDKGMDGKVRTRQILPVRFVPLTGGPG